MVLRLISRSPRGPGFLAPVAPEKRASQELDASVGASGPHDFAVRFRRRSSDVAKASTASRTNDRDDHDTPLLWNGTDESIMLCLANRETKYFSLKGWTQRQDTKWQSQPVGQISWPSSPLPLWERVARMSGANSRRVRGLFPRLQTPHPPSLINSAKVPSPTRGEGRGYRVINPRSAASAAARSP